MLPQMEANINPRNAPKPILFAAPTAPSELLGGNHPGYIALDPQF